MISFQCCICHSHTGVKFCQISNTKAVLCGHLSLLQCTAFVLIQIPSLSLCCLLVCNNCVLVSGISREKCMGRIFVVELEGRPYRCKFCRTHLALPNDIVSRGFRSRHGKAYLFNNAVNITMGPLEERMMLSGMHTVADIFCCCCGQIVGWKYQLAHDNAQKYKEGKFVLERGRIIDEMDCSMEIFIDNRHVSDAEDA